jgi:hypothetical protein
MKNMPTTFFKDFIFEAFLSFQRKAGKHSVTAFAQYLSKNNFKTKFSQQLVSGWINGDFKPSEKYAPALAEILGDEIYDILEFKRPDPDLQRLTQIWQSIPSKARRKILEQGEQYATKKDDDERPIENPA